MLQWARACFISDSYCCVGKLSNPVSAAHPVFASAEPEYGYRSGQFGAGYRVRTDDLNFGKVTLYQLS